MQGRGAFQPVAGRQRSEPGYLIEGVEPGCWPGGPMGVGPLPGFPMMPLSSLEIPPPPPLQLPGSMQHLGGQGPSSRRTTTETGSGGGRPITLPKRWVLCRPRVVCSKRGCHAPLSLTVACNTLQIH